MGGSMLHAELERKVTVGGRGQDHTVVPVPADIVPKKVDIELSVQATADIQLYPGIRVVVRLNPHHAEIPARLEGIAGAAGSGNLATADVHPCDAEAGAVRIGRVRV